MNKLKQLKLRANHLALAGAVVVMASPLGAFAQTTPTDVETAITDAKTTILALIVVGGLAMVSVAVAKVGYGVAAKWIGRLGSKS